MRPNRTAARLRSCFHSFKDLQFLYKKVLYYNFIKFIYKKLLKTIEAINVILIEHKFITLINILVVKLRLHV